MTPRSQTTLKVGGLLAQAYTVSNVCTGRGEAPTLDAEVSLDTASVDSAPSPTSFAPSSQSTAYARYRKRIPLALRTHARTTSQSLSRLQDACSGIVRGQLGQGENAAFLDRFRYTIVASDLLNEHHQAYPKQDATVGTNTSCIEQGVKPVFSTNGVFGIAAAGFVLAASIAWARSISGHSNFVHLLLLGALLAIGGTGFYFLTRRKWLQRVRAGAMESAASFISNAKAFDAALMTAVTIIQEVELVARGYRDRKSVV